MNKNNGIILVSVLLLIFFLFQLFLTHQHPDLLWDENVYLSNARGHLESTNFSEDFRFPFLELYILPLWFVFGISVFVAKLLVILFSVGTLFIFYLLSRFYIKSWWLRFSLLFFFAFSKLFLFWSFRVYTDIPSLFFFLLSWYLFLLYFSKKKNSFYLLFFSGVSSAFAFFTRFPAAVGLAVSVILAIKRRWKELSYLLAGFFIIFIPWSIKNLVQYGNPIWDLTAQASIIGLYTRWQSPVILLKFIFSSFGLLLLFAIGAGYYLLSNKHKLSSQLLILFSSLLTVYYLFFINLKLERYVLALFPLILLLIGIGFEQFLSLHFFKKTLRRYVFISVFISLFVWSLFISPLWGNHYSALLTYDSDTAMRQSLDYAEKNISSSDLIVSNFWPWLGFQGNHRVSSPWSLVPSELLVNDDFAWVLMHNRLGFNYDSMLNISDCFKTFNGSNGEVVTLCRLEK